MLKRDYSHLAIEEARGCSGDRGSLAIIGCGLKAMSQITREAIAFLKSADVVFSGLVATSPDRRWLEFMLGAPTIDLNQFYPTDPRASRFSCYVKGAEAVLRECRRGRRVALVSYGHPTLADATGELLLRRARAEGHRVRCVAGVSSVAALQADLGFDASEGTLTCTASALLGGGLLPRDAGGRATIPHLVLLMPDAVGDETTGAELAGGRASLCDVAEWRALVALLSSAYGAGARCVLYRAPTWASAREASHSIA
jgi:siroheme synthase